jgi:hypothetical protein
MLGSVTDRDDYYRVRTVAVNDAIIAMINLPITQGFIPVNKALAFRRAS